MYILHTSHYIEPNRKELRFENGSGDGTTEGEGHSFHSVHRFVHFLLNHSFPNLFRLLSPLPAPFSCKCTYRRSGIPIPGPPSPANVHTKSTYPCKQFQASVISRVHSHGQCDNTALLTLEQLPQLLRKGEVNLASSEGSAGSKHATVEL